MTRPHASERLAEMHRETAEFVASRTGSTPDVVMILGSGLGDLADSVESGVVLPYSSLPHFPRTSVAGHAGNLVAGRMSGRSVLVVRGRFHLYEGHAPERVVYPVAVAAALGARSLFVTNASGGIRPGFRPGTLMWISDHINWTGCHPTAASTGNPGTSDVHDPRYLIRRTAPCYDAAWRNRAGERAREDGISTEEGTYLWTRGPSYETRAEIRAFRKLGADAVGMSTVPEVLEARRAGMRVIGLSTITNLAAGLGAGSLNHEEVIAAGQSVRRSMERLARIVLETAPR
jgi:purine-nucleoside phosphorylase